MNFKDLEFILSNITVEIFLAEYKTYLLVVPVLKNIRHQIGLQAKLAVTGTQKTLVCICSIKCLFVSNFQYFIREGDNWEAFCPQARKQMPVTEAAERKHACPRQIVICEGAGWLLLGNLS